MRETAQQHPDDFPAAFDRAFAALWVCVETACAAEAEWARGVAAGVRAALAFAAADPPSAWVLALASHAAGREGIDRYYRMLDYFGGLLAPGRDLHPENGPLPAVTERAMIGGLASLIATRLQARSRRRAARPRPRGDPVRPHPLPRRRRGPPHRHGALPACATIHASGVAIE